MKKIAIILCVICLSQFAAISQEVVTKSALGKESSESPEKSKNHQADLLNEFYASYGLGSIFYFVNQNTYDERSTTGTFLFGYSRAVNRIISVGFVLSYGNVNSKSSNEYYDPLTYSYVETTYDNNYWQGIATVKFRYINTPSFCMYSGVGLGVTMDYYTETTGTTSKKRQRMYPAGQMTLLGFRVGRALSFFGEFGFGTNQILNAGLSYKFGK